VYRKMCILCQQTSPKRWIGNRTMTSNCDVTISPHQIQMTPLCHWMKAPHENFLRTPLLALFIFTRVWCNPTHTFNRSRAATRGVVETETETWSKLPDRDSSKNPRLETCVSRSIPRLENLWIMSIFF